MVGDHIIRVPDPFGGSDILALDQHKLDVGRMAVTLIAGDECAAIGLLRIGHIVVNNLADDMALGPALTDV